MRAPYHAHAENFVAILDHLGILRIGGQDAESFLQGQLSCDVTGIAAGASGNGAYCSAKGRMLANFLLWRDDKGFAMVLSRDLVGVVQKQLSRYVLRSDVKISDASETTVLVGTAGARADSVLASFPSIRLNDRRFLFALPATVAPGALKGVQLADSAVWRWLDIRGGQPLVTAATQDQFIPQMANLELLGGVSFEKGCYTGQEIVARSQHLGKIKRRMFLAHVPAPARAGDRLYSDDLGEQTGGTVMNAEPSPEGGYDLLAVVQAESRERSAFHLGSPKGPELRFLPLPYEVA